jgi:hypothetical protein
MDQTIKEQWIDALESGRYEMGRGALREEVNGKDKYCCLGVLCEIAVEEGVIPPGATQPNSYFGNRYYYGNPESADSKIYDSGYLPAAVMNWAGLSECNPRAKAAGHECAGHDGTVTLADLNDSDYYTFKYIARFIGENF